MTKRFITSVSAQLKKAKAITCALPIVASGLLLTACSPEVQRAFSVENMRSDYLFEGNNGTEKRFTNYTKANSVTLDNTARNARTGPLLLTANELINLYAGKTAYGRHNARAGEWTEFTAHDGRALYLNRYGEISDGKWWVSGNQVCFSYGAQTSSSCNLIQRVGAYFQYVQTDGKREFYATKFLNGDDANLIERAAQIR